jgi:uncharacterized protein YbcI
MNSHARRRVHCLRPLRDLPTAATAQTAQADRGAEHAGTAGECAASISQAMVGLLRARTGRGASKARTALSSELAIVTLGDYLTQAERTLAGEGQGKVAIQVRTALLDGMRAEAVAAVEALTGRQVAAYLTAHEHDPDLAIIAFHFGPPAGTL